MPTISNINWMDLSSTSNRHIQTYIRGFLDISCGNILSNGPYPNALVIRNGDASLNGNVIVGGFTNFNGPININSNMIVKSGSTISFPNNSINGASISNTTITGTQISNSATISAANQIFFANNSIPSTAISGGVGTSIGSGSISGFQIASKTISGFNILDNTITGTQISNSATISAANQIFFANNSIPSTAISGGVGTNITAGSISGFQISSQTISGFNILNNTITGTQISNSATISAANQIFFANNSIPSTAISGGVGTNITAGSISGFQIASLTISGFNILDNTITGNKIVNGSISSVQLTNNNIFVDTSNNQTVTGTKTFSNEIAFTNNANIVSNNGNVYLKPSPTGGNTVVINGNLSVNGNTIITNTLVQVTEELDISSGAPYSLKVTQSSTGNIVSFNTISSTALLINQYGNVGIGTQTPTNTLDVSGSGKLSGLLTLNNGLTVASGTGAITFPVNSIDGTYIKNNTITGTQIANNSISAATQIYFANNSIPSNAIIGGVSSNFTTDISGTSRLFIGSDVSFNGLLSVGSDILGNANLYINGTSNAASFNATSDYRIKTNIYPLSNKSDFFTVDKLIPVSYHRKDLSRNEYGFIAHEVQEIYPDIVTGEKDGVGYQHLNYTALIPILVKEVQELKQKNNLLENRINLLEKLINK